MRVFLSVLKAVFISFLMVKISFGFSIEELVKSLKNEQIYGDFNQSKTIVGFKNEIVLSGTFSIFENSYEQNTTKPINSQIKVDKSGIFERVNGAYVKIPEVFDGKLFLDIISLNLGELKSEFDYTLNGDSDGWEVVLTPKNIIAKVFKDIRISGDKFVKIVILNETSGDISKYEFYGIKQL